MKKTIASIFIIISLLLLVACGEKINDSNKTENSEKKTSFFKKDKIVNEDGEEFTPDISFNGELKSNAESLKSTNFELAGKVYKFPINMSELFNNGWTLSEGYEYQTEFDANSSTNLVSYYLVHENGMKIHLDQMTNESNEKKDIKDCILTGFSIGEDDDLDYVIPGGITEKSTAANVLSVFGDPNNTNNFTGYSYSMDDQLTYSKHKNSNISYTFTFNEDGSIYSIHIDSK